MKKEEYKTIKINISSWVNSFFNAFLIFFNFIFKFNFVAKM